MKDSSAHRVAKHRARKRSTPEGCEEVKAKNREYKARSRRKKEIKSLTDARSIKRDNLCPEQKEYVDEKVLKYKTLEVEKKMEQKCDDNQASGLTLDEEQEMDVDVLKYEVELMKKVQANETELLCKYYGKLGIEMGVELVDADANTPTSPKSARKKHENERGIQ